MKTLLFLATLSVIGIQAQDAKKSDEKRPQNRIIAVLDANHDGVVDETEINNATVALKKLDKNGDGKLTGMELRAQRDGEERPAKGAKGDKRKKKKNLQ